MIEELRTHARMSLESDGDGKGGKGGGGGGTVVSRLVRRASRSLGVALGNFHAAMGAGDGGAAAADDAVDAATHTAGHDGHTVVKLSELRHVGTEGHLRPDEFEKAHLRQSALTPHVRRRSGATDESTALAAGAGAERLRWAVNRHALGDAHVARATDNTRASRSVATDSLKEDLARRHSMGRDRSILVTQKVTADLRTADQRDAFDPAEMIEPFVEAYRRGDSTGSSDGAESSDFGGDADHMEALAVEGAADRGEPGWASAPRANYQDLVSGVNKIGHGAYGSEAHQAVVSAHDAAAVSAHSAGSLATMAVREARFVGASTLPPTPRAPRRRARRRRRWRRRRRRGGCARRRSGRCATAASLARSTRSTTCARRGAPPPRRSRRRRPPPATRRRG